MLNTVSKVVLGNDVVNEDTSLGYTLFQDMAFAPERKEQSWEKSQLNYSVRSAWDLRNSNDAVMWIKSWLYKDS